MIETATIIGCRVCKFKMTLSIKEESCYDQKADWCRQFECDKEGYSTCLGIEHKGKLIACIMRHRNGSLGILHVDEDHRRQRLGEVLLASATKALEQTKDPVFAYIVDGNAASEILFTKLGWSKTFSGKKGTGIRRAKRLWEYRGGA